MPASAGMTGAHSQLVSDAMAFVHRREHRPRRESVAGEPHLEPLRPQRRGEAVVGEARRRVREERDVLESYRLGVAAYLVKPVQPEAFLDAVSRLRLT